MSMEILIDLFGGIVLLLGEIFLVFLILFAIIHLFAFFSFEIIDLIDNLKGDE